MTSEFNEQAEKRYAQKTVISCPAAKRSNPSITHSCARMIICQSG